MKLTDLIEYVVDNKNGPGSTPNNQEIGYLGIVVKMKPSMFLKLASPLGKETSVDFFRERIKNKDGIGSPMLYIKVPDAWKEEDFTIDDEGTSRSHSDVYVRSHEGRNRMTAIMKEEGDEPVEVHILLRSDHVEWKSKHISSTVKKELNKGCYRENRRSEWIEGPLFRE
jgi:hypothetical protein